MLCCYRDSLQSATDADVRLFEFDRRFEQQYGEKFVFYDYNEPLNFDAQLKASFDLLIADPPHLSETCMVNYGISIRSLLERGGKIIFLSALSMKDLVRPQRAH